MNRLSELQRISHVADEGRHARLFDVRTSLDRADARPRLIYFLAGRGGLLRRLGVRRGSVCEIDPSAVRLTGQTAGSQKAISKRENQKEAGHE